MLRNRNLASKLLLAALCFVVAIEARAADWTEVSKTSTALETLAKEEPSTERLGEGGVNGGGGDASARRIKAIKTLIGIRDASGESAFTGKTARIKEKLLSLLKTIQAIPPEGEMGQLIRRLLDSGFEEDIKHGQYDLKRACYEGKVEKSASTDKVDRTRDKSIPIPAICLNAHKLALESAQEEDLVGLLAHEHARHFGLEDTDELGMHPLAEAVASWYQASKAGVGESIAAMPGVHLRWTGSNAYLDFSSGEKVKLTFKNLMGSCQQAIFQYGYDNMIDKCWGVREGKICWWNIKDAHLRSGDAEVFGPFYAALDHIRLFSTNHTSFSRLRHKTEEKECSATLLIEYDGQKLSEIPLDLIYGRDPTIHLRQSIRYEP
jgi:hypothetical protein